MTLPSETSPREPSAPGDQDRGLWLAALMNRWQWIIVFAFGLVALWIRVAPRFYLVFQPGFVNFQEGDGWYHVRVAENLVRHFPWRIAVDPYVAFGRVQDTATAPFYDWLLGLIAWLAGGGAPSESLLHIIAAWYPAVLGGFTVFAVFVLAKLVFGLRAALLASAVIATLPGHFLRVSSLGFTDHHIMESLLVTLFFFLLLRAIQQPHSFGWAITAGLVLAAYLLTFHGSALVVGIVVAWAIYNQVRSFERGEESPFSPTPLYLVFSVALAICLVFHSLLWMNYTIAALGLGGLAIVALELWGRWCGRFARPRFPFLAGIAVAGSASVVSAVLLVPGVRHSVKSLVPRLMPAVFGTSGQVYELQSLIYSRGHFTLVPALLQFYGAYFFALLGLVLLAETTLKRPDLRRTLIFFWGFITFILAMGQLRMTYYFAIAVALLTGYVADILIAYGRKTSLVVCLCFVLLVLVPNIYAAVNNDESTGISADWKETLDWMRASTPEPFGDPAFYYARYRREQYGPGYEHPPSAYSVMAWWDYGYWILGVGRRIPVTNPTQTNAGVAADFFLAQSEAEALPILRAWSTRYVILDERLPIWPSEEDLIVGDFPAFFDYTRTHRRDDYLLMAYVPNPNGKPKPKLFYRPAYYRSLVIRLFVFGGQAVDGRGGAVIVWTEQKTLSRGEAFPEVIRTQRFESPEEAVAAENACRNEGCVLVGDNPMISCVPLEAVRQFRPVFQSKLAVLGFGNNGRKAVQTFQVTEPSR